MKKYKIPKNILQLPFKTNISVLLFSSILLAFAFISLSIVEGIQNNIKKNISQNYNSHWSISKSKDTYSLESWWDTTPDEITKLTDHEYIRGITTRSSLKALYDNSPVYITVIEDNDTNVFATEKTISSNQLHISSHLAKKLGVDIGSDMSFYIPILDETLSNLTVDDIFEPVDFFYGDYGIYIHYSSISNIIESKHQRYHVRFLASPLLHLVESTIDNNLFKHNIKRVDSYLEYQIGQLNSIKKIIYRCIYLIYVLLGFVFFLYHYSTLHQQKLDSYAYRNGFIKRQIPVLQFFTSCIMRLVSSTILAILITLAFVKLSIPFDSSSITMPFYLEYNLPLTYSFSAGLPYLTSIPLGIILGIISNGALLLCMKSPNINTEYSFLIMIFIALVGCLISHQYINTNFAREGRNDYWRQNFFGRYTLTSEHYHEYTSFGFSPPSFSLPVDSFNIFNENQSSYMASYETYGEISAIATNSSKATPLTQKYIPIKSIQGNLSQFSNILEILNTNQIVAGRNLENYFAKDNSVSLYIIHKDSKVALSNIQATVIDIPIGAFNDTVFVNHSYLMSLLGLEIDQTTKLQFTGNKTYITPLTNEQAVISSLGENTSYWNKLSDFSIWALFVQTLLLGVCVAVFILAMMLDIYAKDNLFINHIWGIKSNPLHQNSIIYACCFAVGVSLSWFINLIGCLQKQSLPDFLYIPNLVPKDILFSPNWIVAPLLLVGFALFFIIVYYIFMHIIKQIQNTINKDYLS